ncbi:hypothetical protein [Vibrio spartinae]|uniref:DUF1240 domain-containing protein n=1 Tax=Vibrio spartinae TaxID=1918945 RepID=A0A1N6M240_9VIBR|nr:hypothetical protein [Vibrio spartinae]SIO93503.1 hypothetical protein VSP9026_01171 [Vibrio spartinae]
MKGKTNILNLIFVSLLSTALAIFGFVYFYSASNDLFHSINNLSPVIQYQRGAMYGLGGGISFSCLVITFSILIFYKKIPFKIEKKLMKIFFTGLVLMLVVPVLTGIIIPHIIEGKGYQRCEKAERRASWPIFRIHIYTDNRQVCEQLIEEKQQSGRY